MGLFSLEGKVALITGGNTGIGQGIAYAMAEAGADIYVAAHAKKNWEETEKVITEKGSKVFFYELDLTSKEARLSMVDDCLKRYDKIDILVNNAGILRRAPIEEYADEDWAYVMDLNINAVYYLSKLVLDRSMLKQKSGKIINLASMLSYQGGLYVPPYAASKHAIVGLTRSFANELASKNIQVNGIAPGYIKTQNTLGIRQDPKRAPTILARIPTGRWGEPSDIGGAAVFLASKASDYVNAHILAVDGGWLSR